VPFPSYANWYANQIRYLNSCRTLSTSPHRLAARRGHHVQRVVSDGSDGAFAVEPDPPGVSGYDLAGGGRSGGITGETGSSLRLSGFSRKTSGYLSGLVFCSGSVDRQT
jgi:hypothetical protein